MSFARVIQYIEPADSQVKVREYADFLLAQDGLIGLRILAELGSPGWQWYQPWRVQAFFDPENATENTLLPDGCTLVLLPSGMRSTLETPDNGSQNLTQVPGDGQ